MQLWPCTRGQMSHLSLESEHIKENLVELLVIQIKDKFQKAGL